MADIKAFNGMRFTEKAGEISALTCPPYDIISEQQRLAYLERNGNNIIRLHVMFFNILIIFYASMNNHFVLIRYYAVDLLFKRGNYLLNGTKPAFCLIANIKILLKIR